MSIDVFNYGETQVRTLVIDGEPWFVAADVCAVLSIANVSQAMTYLDDDERRVTLISNEGGQQRPTNIISESGLYSLILRSRKAEAKTFKRWITREVLPAIRRTGSYSTVPELSPDQLIAKALTVATERIAAAEAKVAELEPPAKAWTSLAQADGDFTVSDSAKVLGRDGISTGPRKLFDWLEAHGWLFRRGGRWQAKQTAVNAGLVVERITSGYFDEMTGERKQGNPQVRITPKGIEKLRCLLEEERRLVVVP